jgi:hypothetical protein
VVGFNGLVTRATWPLAPCVALQLKSSLQFTRRVVYEIESSTLIKHQFKKQYRIG